MELSKVCRDGCRAGEYIRLSKVSNIVPLLALRPIPEDMSVIG